MVVGHFGVAFLARRAEPGISLGTAVLAAILVDLVCFVLLIAGVERFETVPGARLNRLVGHDIAYSHSLLMGVMSAALFAGVYFLVRRYPRGAWILFGLVLSHWVLDFVSHRPDMRLAPGVGPAFGLGLWNSLPAALAVEGGFWVLAMVVYVRATRARNWAGIYGFWPVAALLGLALYANITAGVGSDPVKAGINGLITFSLLVAWAYWMNRVRVLRTLE